MKGKPRRSGSEGIEGVITALGLSFTGPPASSRRPSADEAPGFKKAYKMLCDSQHTKTHIHRRAHTQTIPFSVRATAREKLFREFR